MEFTGFLISSLVIGSIGALVVLVLAIVQEGKLGGRGLSVRNGFYAAVSLVLLAITVAATVFVVNLTLTTWVFTKAPYTRGYEVSTPPTPTFGPVVSEGVKAPVPADGTVSYRYTCTAGCQFTADEVQAVHDWAPVYSDWRSKNHPESILTTARRRDLVNALSFLLVGLPLFLVFFRILRRSGPSEPRVVRSVYFYYAAFAGLVMAVVAGALLVNVALKAVTGVGDSPNPGNVRPLLVQDPNVAILKSVTACQAQCGFTTTENQLAQQWQNDYQIMQNRITGVGTSKAQGDLAIYLPLLAVGVPLFLFHFAQARRETGGTVPTGESKRKPGRPKGSRNRKS